MQPPVGHLPDAKLAPLLRRHALGLGPHLGHHDVDHVLEVVGAGTDDIARTHRRMQRQRLERRRPSQQRLVGGRLEGLGDTLQRREITLPIIQHRQRAAVAMEIQPLARHEILQRAERDDAPGGHQPAKRCTAGGGKRPQFKGGCHRNLEALGARSGGSGADISAAGNYSYGVAALARRNNKYP